jgi:uncharacterized phage protein (TIGR02216 family)
VLRLAPRDFWAMTVTEWNAAVAGFHAAHGIAQPLARADLDQLMQLYPDIRHE